MITRVEIDGFKTFKDFSVELAPFQVIVNILRAAIIDVYSLYEPLGRKIRLERLMQLSAIPAICQ